MKLNGISNCDFEWFNISQVSETPTAQIIGCHDLRFYGCEFSNQYGVSINIENSYDILFDTCVLGSGNGDPRSVIVTDNTSSSTAYRHIAFDNCTFKRYLYSVEEGADYIAVDASGVGSFTWNGYTNSISRITLSSCHFEDLTAITAANIKGGSFTAYGTNEKISAVQIQSTGGIHPKELPTPKASDAGKFVVVSESGGYELFEVETYNGEVV